MASYSLSEFPLSISKDSLTVQNDENHSQNGSENHTQNGSENHPQNGSDNGVWIWSWDEKSAQIRRKMYQIFSPELRENPGFETIDFPNKIIFRFLKNVHWFCEQIVY